MSHHLVALLVDGDNLRGRRWTELIDTANRFGRIGVARLYTDFGAISDAGTGARMAGFEPIHVPGKRSAGGMKSMVDVQLAVDAIAIMHDSPETTCLVLGSGDADFLPVLRYWKRHGRLVVVVSNVDQLASELRGVADEVVTYSGGASQTRQPAPVGAPTPAQLRETLLALSGDTRLTDRETNLPFVRADWLYENLLERYPSASAVVPDLDALTRFIADQVPEFEPLDARARSFFVGANAAARGESSRSSPDEILTVFSELCREALPADNSWISANTVYNEGKRLLEEGASLHLPANRPSGWFRSLMEKTAGVEIRQGDAGRLEMRRV